MYHELDVPGRTLCQSEPGYVRYVVPHTAFESQMRSLKSAGWRGLSVSDALRFPEGSCVALTFDDGSETDLLTAAPALQALGYGATFFITVGFLGTPGHLTQAQLRELSNAGFEIGCHSMTHPYLSDLSGDVLEREILDSKKQLEDLTGRPVEHFSCPGGRYNARVQDIVRQGGYRSMNTSRFYANTSSTNPFELGRVAIMRNTSLSAFQQICRNQGLWRKRAIDRMRSGTKRVMGNSAYDAVRALLLRGGEHSNPTD
jgi:peptidoglycan/xylan/chitin deacetylase (PgdA/CDA1 family)